MKKCHEEQCTFGDLLFCFLEHTKQFARESPGVLGKITDSRAHFRDCEQWGSHKVRALHLNSISGDSKHRRSTLGNTVPDNVKTKRSKVYDGIKKKLSNQHKLGQSFGTCHSHLSTGTNIPCTFLTSS